MTEIVLYSQPKDTEKSGVITKIVDVENQRVELELNNLKEGINREVVILDALNENGDNRGRS